FQMRAHRDPAAPSPVLSVASLRQMHKPRYLAGDDWTQAWGISWCANRQDDSTWITHSGGVPGYTSTVCFDPETQVGAIVLLNGTTSSVAVAMDLAATARRLAGSGPPPVQAPAPAPREYRRCSASMLGPAWAAGCSGSSGATGSSPPPSANRSAGSLRSHRPATRTRSPSNRGPA